MSQFSFFVILPQHRQTQNVSSHCFFAPGYYLGNSKVTLNNINLPHQRQKLCCELFGAKNCQQGHLRAKSCGHPWWCPPEAAQLFRTIWHSVLESEVDHVMESKVDHVVEVSVDLKTVFCCKLTKFANHILTGCWKKCTPRIFPGPWSLWTAGVT